MSALAIDTETNGKDVRYSPDFRMLGLSYASRTDGECTAEYLPIGHLANNLQFDNVLFKVRALLGDHDQIVFHNAGFDLQVIKRGLGIDLWDSDWYCTMHMQHFINENFPSKKLDYMGKILLGKEKLHDERMDNFIKGLGWGFIPVWLMSDYAKQDALLTLELFELLYPQFVSQGFVRNDSKLISV